SPERTREFLEVATAEGLTLPVALQPQYNLVNRNAFEQGYAPLAREYDLAVFPYFALASGFLTGQYRSESDLAGKARESMASGYLPTAGLAVVDVLARGAGARGVAPATVGLAGLRGTGLT